MVANRRRLCVTGRTRKLEMISIGTTIGRMYHGTPEGTVASLKYFRPFFLIPMMIQVKYTMPAMT
ncbi:hypothetical protein D3C73_1554400 [compost metagenome]